MSDGQLEHELVDTFDLAPITKATRDDSGFLRVTATVTAPGVFEYVRDGVRRRELKSADELYSTKHLDSVHGAVVTLLHPEGGVSVGPDNAEQLKKGHSRSAPVVTGDGMLVDLMATDADLIASIESKKTTSVSLGMRNWFDLTPGVWKDNAGIEHPYDVVQRGMITNHIAIVPQGRVPTAQLHLDSAEQKEEKKMPEEVTGKVTINGAGFAVEVNAAATINAHIQTLDEQIVSLKSKVEETTTSYDELIEEKDKVTAARDAMTAERDAAKEKLSSADSIDINKLVTERLAFIGRAKTVLTEDQFKEVSEKTDLEIMRATCDSNGVDLKDKSDAYIHARFDGLVDAKSSSNDDVLRDASLHVVSKTSDANDMADLNKRMAAARSAKRKVS